MRARAPFTPPHQRSAGVGNDPRLVLHATDGDDMQRFLADHQALVQQTAYAPFEKGYMWLVRPDGYVAIVADAGNWNAMREYLDVIAGQPEMLRSNG